MRLDDKRRRELLGLAAIAAGAFIALALLPWRLTGPVGAWLGTNLWWLLGLGALVFPALGATVALTAFRRIGPASIPRVAVLTLGVGLLVPCGVGVIVRIQPEAFLSPFEDWGVAARLVGFLPGFIAHGTVAVLGVTGSVLVGVLVLSGLTVVTVGWHPLVILQRGRGAWGRARFGGLTLEGGRGETQLPNPGAAPTPAVVLGEAPTTLASSLPSTPAAPPKPKLKRRSKTLDPYQHLPPIDILARPPETDFQAGQAELDRLGETLIDTLRTFKVEGRISGRTTGPVVTQFEVSPGPGVKVGQIAALADDLALAMRAQSIRVVAPIPGKAAVGVEIPNPQGQLVTVRELIEGESWAAKRAALPIALGRDLRGRGIVADLVTMPHLLIAGATGSGKSVCINSIITSLIYRYTPRELRLLLIDPKMVELSMYNVLPHLRHPVITDNHEAARVLKWAVREMERRYRLFHANGARNILDFNRKVAQEKELVLPEGEEAWNARPSEPDITGAPGEFPSLTRRYTDGALPYIVVVVDELADLMMTVQSEVEAPLAMLAQKARAIGIQLALSTQRPSVNVITGLIKANFPSRIAFRVASKVDSRTILDQNGAEALLGNGDMLFLPPAQSEPIRIQGCFISTEETEQLMEWYGRASEAGVVSEEPDILEQIAAIEAREADQGDEQGRASAEVRSRDPLFRRAAELCIQNQLGSTSLLQRRLSIGYGRAARIIDQLEMAGVLGAPNASKPREVLIGLEDLDRLDW